MSDCGFRKNGFMGKVIRGLDSLLHVSTFSGIGGFDLAAEWMGWNNVVSCEINPFSRRVLEYYWPDSYHHDDIRTLSYELIDLELSKRYGKDWRSNDIIFTGGFPCQPFSNAGQRKGTEDDRHLWPEMYRCIQEIKPRWIVGENVRGIVNWSEGLVFEQVCADLEAAGYEVWPYLLPAASVGAPHRRDRVWFVAHSEGGWSGGVRDSGQAKGSCDSDELSGVEFGISDEGRTTPNPKDIRRAQRKQDPESGEMAIKGGDVKHSHGTGREKQHVSEITVKSFQSDWKFDDVAYSGGIGQQRSGWAKRRGNQEKEGDWKKHRTFHDGRWPTESPICVRNDGFSSGLDGITISQWERESIKGAGNAIVPQVVYQIFRAIEDFRRLKE